MKILSANQMREADAFTIKNEPVSSISLMERAAGACCDWIVRNYPNRKYAIICGPGNNGGDGLIIGKMLSGFRWPVEIFIIASTNYSDDFTKNFAIVKGSGIKVKELKEGEMPVFVDDVLIIDAVFGTGLSRPVTGWIGSCIDAINSSGCEVISIDLPSGMFADAHTEKAVHANHTLSFQNPKLGFFFGENEKFLGEVHLLDIGLDKNFIDRIGSKKFIYGPRDVSKLLRERKKFSHKGDFGHSLLVAGSRGKIGAAVLAGRSCLRCGTGLLTIHAPGCGYEILQTSLPEAMVETDDHADFNSYLHELSAYDAIGIGPGIGKAEETKNLLFELLENSEVPLVIDADALNILSEHPEKLKKLPANSILTPHPKEFERLAGKSENDFERHEKQLRFSEEHNVIVVLKGANTCISLPDGTAYFNTTGNPGMAKGGTGDVLTGMILSFLAQKYEPQNAALLGVCLHGLAGDIAAEKKGVDSMLCSDLIDSIPKAFKKCLAQGR